MDQPDATDPTFARGPSSLTRVIDHLRAEGYGADLTALEGGDIRCGACEQASPAAEFRTGELRRTEGASDPSDMSAVIGLTCPACGAAGVLVARYGPEVGVADADVLVAIDSAPPPPVG